MSNLKLGVEVVSAHDLLPKEQETSNAFVEVEFDNQRFRTAIKERDINPVWNEQFFFNVSDPSCLHGKEFQAYVYHANRASNKTTCLGKVRISGTSFVNQNQPDAAPLYYTLEKRSILSGAQGELSLRVFLTDDPSVTGSAPAQDFNFAGTSTTALEQAAGNAVLNPSQDQQQPVDFQLKETSPTLGAGRTVNGRSMPGENAGAYELVEKMHILFVRVVKARDLPYIDLTRSLDPYVEVHLGKYEIKTKFSVKNERPEWDEVFAFPKDAPEASALEVVLKDRDTITDDYVGRVMLDLNDVPDSPLAPEWHCLMDKDGTRDRWELMLAAWYGTQADECFPSAIHASSMLIQSHVRKYMRGKVYLKPTLLWYVRVNVIEAQDIFTAEHHHTHDVFVKVRLRDQFEKTRKVSSSSKNFMWNEEMMFVAAEPFEDDFIVQIADCVGNNIYEVIGEAIIPLAGLQRRADLKVAVCPVWFDLRRPGLIDGNQLKEDKLYPKVSLRVCLEGGYHVLDESALNCTDARPTMKQLWKPPIGLLEVGILSAKVFTPTKMRHERESIHLYCVAKYGHKWVRTRTIFDNMNPQFNEQYTWDVFDHGTVLNICLFDNREYDNNSSHDSPSHIDKPIGKLQIRISTLETRRVYTHNYPVLVFYPSGVKNLCELHLAIRFTVTSQLNVFLAYSRPLHPWMHFAKPLSVIQQEKLRHQSVQLVAQQLGRMEPPLSKEVVEFISDARSILWSMRRSKANLFRIIQVFSGLYAAWKWFGDICQWKNPVTSVLVHMLFTVLFFYPNLILKTILLYMLLVGLWKYRSRPGGPPHMSTTISCADGALPDELDEEYDTFPTSKSPDLIRTRYDRLRFQCGRVQVRAGDFATYGERLQSLLSWRDPRATAMFLLFCLFTEIVLCVIPFQVVTIFFWMRHPWFRRVQPPALACFVRRLPAMTDCLM